MIFAIDAIAMFALIAFASYVFLGNLDDRNKTYAAKWVCIPWTAIFFMNQLEIDMEFTALGLLIISLAAIASVVVKRPVDAA